MKRTTKLRAFNFLSEFGTRKTENSANTNIRTKFNNICAKTAKYDVPDELFQKRTSRTNRVLISWTAVKENNLTMDQLKTFSGGVVVEFINEDYFSEEDYSNPMFQNLINLIGSDDLVSAMISIRSESGSSSSAVQREYFLRLVDNTEVNYKGKTVVLTENNYHDFAITKKQSSGSKGNDAWDGFLFVSIRGGQQDITQTHRGKQYTLFNPACEYANKSVCLDIDLVMSYFALRSVNVNELDTDLQNIYTELQNDIQSILKDTYYDNSDFTGNLLDYCENHPSMQMVPDKLYDTVQVQEIHVRDFDISYMNDERNLDFTHNEAVNRELYYWDSVQKCILTPARPTNIFWSKQLSNMMQQNFTLDGYFNHEEEIVERRKNLLNLHSNN